MRLKSDPKFLSLSLSRWPLFPHFRTVLNSKLSVASSTDTPWVSIFIFISRLPRKLDLFLSIANPCTCVFQPLLLFLAHFHFVLLQYTLRHELSELNQLQRHRKNNTFLSILLPLQSNIFSLTALVLPSYLKEKSVPSICTSSNVQCPFNRLHRAAVPVTALS